ncbi:hypothetical protein NUW54_g8374 [Trametes sanguinea]|uniref:Uncharacterized protein n=1 Tax=Trametes sanguinea TaxID=158606 RepID=A0ACC1PDX4_9APHY|nr:hypothetical protein NUW54_g8374 [Trametes sanguinea]
MPASYATSTSDEIVQHLHRKGKGGSHVLFKRESRSAMLQATSEIRIEGSVHPRFGKNHILLRILWSHIPLVPTRLAIVSRHRQLRTPPSLVSLVCLAGTPPTPLYILRTRAAASPGMSSADASSVAVPNLGVSMGSDNPAVPFIGGLLIEIFVACILYGITTLQSFMYFQKYPNDAISLKILVGTVCASLQTHRALESVHTAFCMQFLYAYLVEGFADYTYFLKINWCASPSSAKHSP